jgi:hypothetical protein
MRTPQPEKGRRRCGRPKLKGALVHLADYLGLVNHHRAGVKKKTLGTNEYFNLGAKREIGMSEETVKPGEWEKLLDFVEKTIPLPAWIKITIALLVLVALVSVILAVLVKTCSLILELWAEKIKPRFSSPEKRQRAAVRRLFARHLRTEIETRNRLENWRDEEFTELEAEVEAEGGRRSAVPFVRRSGGVRRESSLTTALQRSTERLILVQGEPGSGKSVALRHVAHQLADKASYAHRLDRKLPVYVNLKEISRSSDQAIDRDLIRNFVLKSLNRVNDRSVTEFLEVNFDDGIRDGSWVFLFDSFDEIPDVLSSTEADETVLAYSNAISDFLSGLNACRGVVASREYRGPASQGWRAFRVLQLSTARQNRLIRLAFMNYPARVESLQAGLSAATDDVRSMTRNPMLLGLLCEHVRLGHTFPQTAYEVYSKYIEYRFAKDAYRVVERHGIDTNQVRDIAEKIAFTMAAEPALGLNPKRVDVLPALQRQGFNIAKSRLIRAFNALEYMKIGRADNAVIDEEAREFTFAHRRFQEYFATAIVISDSSRIPPSQLLLDARWRETAVVLCQTGDPSHVEPIIAEAASFLVAGLAELRSATGPANGEPFPWPSGMLHLLGILQAGFPSVSDRSVALLRDQAGDLLEVAFAQGDFLDKKYALEFSGIAPQPTLARLVNEAYGLNSQWLSDIIFRQVGRLSSLRPSILGWIRKYLLTMSFSGQFAREAASIRAYIARLPNAAEMQRVATFAGWLPTLDALCWVFVFISLAIIFHNSSWLYSIMSVGLLVYVIHKWTLLLIISSENADTVLVALIAGIWPISGIWLESFSSMQAMLTILIIYLIGWTYSSIVCIGKGETATIFIWPITPFLLFYRFLQGVIRAPFLFLSLGLKKIVFSILGVTLAGAAITAGLALTAVAVGFGFQLFQDILLVRLTVSVVGAFLCLVSFYIVAKWCIDRVSDHIDLRRYRSDFTAGMTAEALLTGYQRLRTRAYKLSLLREIRLRGSLKFTFDGESALRKVAGTIGDDTRQRDEIYRLIEQLVSQRMSPISGGSRKEGTAPYPADWEAKPRDEPRSSMIAS